MDQLQRLAGVGDVVRDEHLLVGEVDRVRHRRQHDRHLQRLAHARVELHVHQVDVLAVQRVRQAAGDEDAAARDGEDDVRLEAVVGDGLGQLTDGRAEGLVREVLANVAHAGYHTCVR